MVEVTLYSFLYANSREARVGWDTSGFQPLYCFGMGESGGKEKAPGPINIALNLPLTSLQSSTGTLSNDDGDTKNDAQ